MTTEKKKVIRCTPANAGEFRDLVRRWPELGDLVGSLQSQNLFPGLRALQITLTGSENELAQGLGAVCAENAPKGLKTEGA